MSEFILFQLAGVLILGIAVQWLAWRLRLPAILLLLAAGLLLGPGSALLAQYHVLSAPLLDPNDLFGDLLLPAVSLAVALILFEGGLTLNLREHAASGGVIWMLVTIGAALRAVIAAAAAHYFLRLDWPLAILVGAILAVTGPTVIGPLLRHVRPTGKVGPILKWEGIIIDPIGAMAAVVVFESLTTGHLEAWPIAQVVLKTILVGTACGGAAAAIIILFFRRHWVPDFLHNGFVLALVLAAFAGANIAQHESGLFAATIMGLALANQRRVNIHHVMEFKESLTVLLISALFIVLGARLTLDQLMMVPWGGMGLFLAALILLGRPAAVYLCTLFSSLSWRERTFIAALAPRGIVAAAVASVFALRLDPQHFPQAQMLVPITFATIIGTVTVYGLTAAFSARKLGLANTGTRGFLFAGAGPFERLLAAAIHEQGHAVLLVDTNRDQIALARMAGLPVIPGSILSHYVLEQTQMAPIGHFLALTPNDEVNALATVQYQRLLSRSEVYQLAPAPRGARQEKVSWELRGRILFAPDITHDALEQRTIAGHTIKKTHLTPDFSFQQFKQMHGPETIPLFLFTETADILLFTAENPPTPRPNQTLFSLTPAKPPSTAPQEAPPQ